MSQQGIKGTGNYSLLSCTSKSGLILNCQLQQQDTNSTGGCVVPVAPSQPLTCDKDLLHRVALHVPSTRHQRHLILCVWPQVANGVLVLIFREVNGCPVPWNVLGAISELYTFNFSQGFGPRDESCGVGDVFGLHLAGGIKLCYQEKERVKGALKRDLAMKNTHILMPLIGDSGQN